jgi:CRP/FNR family transcriptional regulator, cyclic AMP receptor protein
VAILPKRSSRPVRLSHPSELIGDKTAGGTTRVAGTALGAQARYPAGRVLMREAEETTFVLLLLDGVVKATGRAAGEREALLAVRMGGDLIGELAAVDGRPRSATVTTCGPVTARGAPRG